MYAAAEHAHLRFVLFRGGVGVWGCGILGEGLGFGVEGLEFGL